jgi:hypothetical protein
MSKSGGTGRPRTPMLGVDHTPYSLSYTTSVSNISSGLIMDDRMLWEGCITAMEEMTKGTSLQKNTWIREELRLFRQMDTDQGGFGAGGTDAAQDRRLTDGSNRSKPSRNVFFVVVEMITPIDLCRDRIAMI